MIWSLYSAWNLFWSSASIATLIGIAAVLVAVFSGNIIVKFAIPDLRKWAIVVAVCAFGYTFVYDKGYYHGLQVKQAEWDAGIQKEEVKGEEARTDAEHTVGPVTSDRGVFRGDPRNRDSGKVVK